MQFEFSVELRRRGAGGGGGQLGWRIAAEVLKALRQAFSALL